MNPFFGMALRLLGIANVRAIGKRIQEGSPMANMFSFDIKCFSKFCDGPVFKDIASFEGYILFRRSKKSRNVF